MSLPHPREYFVELTPPLQVSYCPTREKWKQKWRTERQERLLFRPRPLQSCRGGEFALDQKLEKEVFSVSMKLLAKRKGLDRLLLNRNSNQLLLAKSASSLWLKEKSSQLGKWNVISLKQIHPEMQPANYLHATGRNFGLRIVQLHL